jgi:hypothetical protein
MKGDRAVASCVVRVGWFCLAAFSGLQACRGNAADPAPDETSVASSAVDDRGGPTPVEPAREVRTASPLAAPQASCDRPPPARAILAIAEFDAALSDTLASGGHRMVLRTGPSGEKAIVLLSVPPRSVYAKLGLCSGDELLTIGGSHVGNLPAAIDAWLRFRERGRTILVLRRDGGTHTIEAVLR